jgi:hypothetical protein
MTDTSDARQAVRIAGSILDRSIPLFLGCKQLLGALSRLGVDDRKPFLTIVGVESETDDYPLLPHVRAMWDQQRLAEKDAELAAYLPKVQEHVFEACRETIRQFGRFADETKTWNVYRLDDDGNQVLVQNFLDDHEAKRLVEDLEARGDGQTYWAECNPSQ